MKTQQHPLKGMRCIKNDILSYWIGKPPFSSYQAGVFKNLAFLVPDTPFTCGGGLKQKGWQSTGSRNVCSSLFSRPVSLTSVGNWSDYEFSQLRLVLWLSRNVDKNTSCIFQYKIEFLVRLFKMFCPRSKIKDTRYFNVSKVKMSLASCS